MPGEKVVWITGAGRGIGRALARRLADSGWIVAASTRTEVDLLSLVAECAPGRVHAFPLDVTDLPQTEASVNDIEAQLGNLDLAVLNAGIHFPVSADNFSVEQFRQVMETNLMGTVNGLAQVIPRFVDRHGGHIAVAGLLLQAVYLGGVFASIYHGVPAGISALIVGIQPLLVAAAAGPVLG
ncbi:MAG: SDR family oxidoreductase, partial [Rhodospirillales bacterium]|nr:SDR family oxidoreductase [Rhodospirillales bacterium]